MGEGAYVTEHVWHTASRPPVPSVPECWELLAKVHTIAAMNDGWLPGETMRDMKAALEAYPEYRQNPADPRDVVLPWAELMDLIAYFNTVGDKRAEAMLRGPTAKAVGRFFMR